MCVCLMTVVSHLADYKRKPVLKRCSEQAFSSYWYFMKNFTFSESVRTLFVVVYMELDGTCVAFNVIPIVKVLLELNPGFAVPILAL